MTTKFCPLLMATLPLRAAAQAQGFGGFGTDALKDDCREGLCAWWNATAQSCTIPMLGWPIVDRWRQGGWPGQDEITGSRRP